MATGLLAAPTALPWPHDDGGRAAAGFSGEAGDCVVRAIAIATGVDYGSVYDEMAARAKAHQAAHPRSRRYVTRSGKPASTSPRDGVIRPVYEPYLIQVVFCQVFSCRFVASFPARVAGFPAVLAAGVGVIS